MDPISFFRQAAPYINTFRGRTFVIAFGGEALQDPGFNYLVHDLALLDSLGIRLVVVHGARPQIEARLQSRGAEIRYAGKLRITDDAALECVKEACGQVRLEIEARLSMGLANSPMANARIRAVSGNFVIARPVGLRDGIDFQHTGQVRRIDATGINAQLQQDNIVLLSPLGFSPTGEVFNLSAEDVAMAAAVALKADKLIYLGEQMLQLGGDNGGLRQLSLEQARALRQDTQLPEPVSHYLSNGIQACEQGIRRVHVLDRHQDGALIQELFTRDGTGTLICADSYDGLRPAIIDDISGILELIAPLEDSGILVKRSRELLEQEIHHFSVLERDGTIIGCAALYPFPEHGMAELACVAVHPDYQRHGRGQILFEHAQKLATNMGLQCMFILTTQASHWFLEQGFEAGKLDELPVSKQQLYNFQRRSQPLFKRL